MSKTQNKIYLIILFSVFLAYCSEDRVTINEPVTDGDYYVSPTGDDQNPGTYDQPWATWQKAFNTAEPGDIVYFRGGVYYLQEGQTADIIGRSGTAENYIHFFNYPGEIPVLDGSLIVPSEPPEGSNGYNGGLYLDRANYIHFKGLSIRNFWQVHDHVFTQGIVSTACRFQIFENITVHNISGRGIYYDPTFSPDSSYFINCDVYDCVDTMNTNDYPGGWADGWQAVTLKGSYLHFEGCRAWGCSDDGFNTTSQGLLVMKNNWSFDNGRLGGDGCGFKINPCADQTINGIHDIIINNVAAFNLNGNTGAGFTENNNGITSTEMQVYNNTSYHNKVGFVTLGWLTGPQRNNDYRNNIAYANIWSGGQVDENIWSGGTFFTNDHNTWNSATGVAVTDDDFVSLNLNELKRPRKKNGMLPYVNFMKLEKGSDLINAGINVGLPFLGKSPDMGAFERE